MRAGDGTSTIEVVRADLLEQDVDAIVNAANEHLAHGGGIAAVISRAAGPELDRESREHATVPTGEAGVTTAGRLPQRAVIHAVGPVWRGGSAGEEELLAGAHRSAIDRAEERSFVSVGLPAISCGVFGYPVRRAAPVALAATRDALSADGTVRLARFCLASDEHLEAFSAALRETATGDWAVEE